MLEKTKKNCRKMPQDNLNNVTKKNTKSLDWQQWYCTVFSSIFHKKNYVFSIFFFNNSDFWLGKLRSEVQARDTLFKINAIRLMSVTFNTIVSINAEIKRLCTICKSFRISQDTIKVLKFFSRFFWINNYSYKSRSTRENPLLQEVRIRTFHLWEIS